MNNCKHRIYDHNSSLIRNTVSKILDRYPVKKPVYIIDKDDHKLYISEQIFPGLSLIYSNCSGHNSSKEILRNLKGYEKGSSVIFFKPTFELIDLAGKMGLVPLQNDYSNNLRIENKIFIYKNAPVLSKGLFPPSLISEISNVDFQESAQIFGIPFFVQFSSGYSGKTTFKIGNPEELTRLKSIYKNLQAKISRAVPGETYTLNGFFHRHKFIYSDPFIQISGKGDLNPNTCGSAGNIFRYLDLDRAIFSSFMDMAGKLLEANNFQGFFGIDFINDKKPYLIEINPRFTTSASIQSEHSILKGRMPEFVFEIIRLILTSKGEAALKYGIDLLSETEADMISYSSKLNITQLIQYNTGKDDYIADGMLDTGTYKIKGRFLRKYNSNILISKINREDIILFAPIPGRRISYGNEIARIIFNSDSFGLDRMINILNNRFCR